MSSAVDSLTSSLPSVVTSSEVQEEGSWLAIPLSVLGLAVSVIVIAISIQYYIKKSLNRDIKVLLERKKKLEKGSSPTPTTQMAVVDEESLKVETRPIRSILKTDVKNTEEPQRERFDTVELERLLNEIADCVVKEHETTGSPPAEDMLNVPMSAERFGIVVRKLVSKTSKPTKFVLATAFAHMLLDSIGVDLTADETPSVLAELEAVAVNWLAKALCIPSEFLFHYNPEKSHGGGLFVQGPEEALLLAVLSVRTSKINEVLGRKDEHYLASRNLDMERVHAESARVLFYTNTKTFALLDRVCKMATVSARLLDSSQKLEAMVLEDVSKGYLPTMVVLESDREDIREQITVAKKHGLVVHLVAYLNYSQQYPVDTLSISLPDSTTVLYTTRLPEFRRLFSKKTPTFFNPSDLGLHERRRAKGFSLWFVCMLLGVEEFRRQLRVGEGKK